MLNILLKIKILDCWNLTGHYINFTKDVNDLKKKFKIFKPLNIGYYEGSLESLKDGGLHYTFFGKKK